jgi:type III secretion apparatus needle protein
MSTVNLQTVHTALTTGVDTAAKNVSDHKVDANDQKSMIELQQKMHQWTMATQMQSNTIKTISEAIKAIISNIR